MLVMVDVWTEAIFSPRKYSSDNQQAGSPNQATSRLLLRSQVLDRGSFITREAAAFIASTWLASASPTCASMTFYRVAVNYFHQGA
ncbi:MAG: hypothetical protein R3C68_17895 [Myxococcota bacterium]